MPYRNQVNPNWNVEVYAGACIVLAQGVVGAGGGPYSATVAANNTQYRHADRKFPGNAIAVLWFSHWGYYTDYRNGEVRYENWGHVVIWNPHAFKGDGGFYSSPRNGYGGEWFRTIREVEIYFNCTYRFWSEDLNSVRAVKWFPANNTKPKPTIKPKPKPKPLPPPIDYEEEEMSATPTYIRDAASKGQGSIYYVRQSDQKKVKIASSVWNAKRAAARQTGEVIVVTDLATKAFNAIPTVK